MLSRSWKVALEKAKGKGVYLLFPLKFEREKVTHNLKLQKLGLGGGSRVSFGER